MTCNIGGASSRLRYFMPRDGPALNSALRILVRVIEQCLRLRCAGAAKLDKALVHIDAVALIHRLGSSLNTHVHFHICAIDGVLMRWGGNATASPLLAKQTLRLKQKKMEKPVKRGGHSQTTQNTDSLQVVPGGISVVTGGGF